MSAILALLAASTASCTLPPGWDSVEARNTHYVVFGEMHGTREAPEFTANVVCALAKQGKRVLFAIEMGARENADLQAAWQQPPDRFATALLTTIDDWGPKYAGSAMSQAVFDALVMLHTAKTRGAAIDVVAFNGARDEAQHAKFAAKPGQGGHEAAQAENIRLATERGRYDKVIVLVGNMHARKQPFENRGVSVDPMAMQLAPAERTTSLALGHAGGAAFNCELRDGVVPVPGKPITSADIECRSRATRSNLELQGPPRIELGDHPPLPKGLYDGIFWVGPVGAVTQAAPATKDVAK